MRRVVLIAFLLGLATASAEASMVVDDFEGGGFTFAAAPHDTVEQTILVTSPGHAIWPHREVTLYGGNGIVLATLSPGTHLDDEVAFTAEGFGYLEFKYDWGFPADLTEGGTVDSLGIDLSLVPASGEVLIAMSDPATFVGINFFHPNTGLNKYGLHRFLDVDPTQATSLTIRFYITDGGRFEINDMRTIGTGATTPNYVPEIVAVQTPPFPTPPLRWRAFNPVGQPLYRANVTIDEARAGRDLAIGADWAETPAFGGEVAGISFSWLEPSAFEDSDFEIRVAMTRLMGRTPEILYPPDPIFPPDPIHPPDPVHPPDPADVANGFLLAFPALVRNTDGHVIGRSNVRIVFDPAAGQGLEFADVAVTPGAAGKSAAISDFVLSFRLKRAGAVDEALPLFAARWEADWTPAAVLTAVEPAAPAGPVGGEGILLSAIPSVTRGGTEIRASLPFARDVVIAIHDVSGRLVRSLPANHGATSVRWDGRDASGERVAPGLYFFRSDAGDRAPSRKILVVE